MKKMDSTKEISMVRQNSLYHSKADRKEGHAAASAASNAKKGDSRSKQTMKNISPQAPAGKYHG